MTRDELLESAALDAFGLLDEYEALLYTRSFHHAPAAVQDEIIQLQANLVSDETFMTPQEPDADLRQRVLDAVAEAIELEAPQLEPLAVIGRARPLAEVAPRAGRMPFATAWRRVAVFALCASLIVMLYEWSKAKEEGNAIAVSALNVYTDAQLDRLIGPTIKDYLFDPSAKRVFFKPSSAGTGMEAVIFINEGSGQAFLVTQALPASKELDYKLSIKDADGARTTIHKFSSNGLLSGARVALKDVAYNLQNVVWEITDRNGQVLLASV